MTLYGISATWCSHHPVTLKRTYHDEEWLRIWLGVEDERSGGGGGGGVRGPIVDFYIAVVLLRALHLQTNVSKSKPAFGNLYLNIPVCGIIM
jgi:hypothetical protein